MFTMWATHILNFAFHVFIYGQPQSKTSESQLKRADDDFFSVD